MFSSFTPHHSVFFSQQEKIFTTRCERYVFATLIGGLEFKNMIAIIKNMISQFVQINFLVHEIKVYYILTKW